MYVTLSLHALVNLANLVNASEHYLVLDMNVFQRIVIVLIFHKTYQYILHAIHSTTVIRYVQTSFKLILVVPQFSGVCI